MKFVKQFLIVLIISFIGEVLGRFLFLPVPGSIYGLVLMLILLITKVIKLDQVKETANFLVAIMPVMFIQPATGLLDVKDVSTFLIEILPLMFIPAAVGLVESYTNFKSILVPVIVITAVSTVIVMGVSGFVTQVIIKHSGKERKEKKHD